VDEIHRDHSFFCVTKNSLKVVLGGVFHLVFDLLVFGRLLELDGEINDGDIGGGDTEGHARKLTIERRNNLTNSFGGTSS